MMPGSTTLGLNSAFTLPGVGPAFARQPLPPWTDEGRIRPVHEPYQGWVSPFGHLADGPLVIRRDVDDKLCHKYYWSKHAHCYHLTIAAQCWFNEDFGTLYVPPNQVRDYAFRPYRWSEEVVQQAYATVSAGAPRAPSATEIHDLAGIGRDPIPPETAEDVVPTDRQRERVEEIHQNWTHEAATLLAFGPSETRPYRWAPSLHADGDMAEKLLYQVNTELGSMMDLGGYNFMDPEEYNVGVQYADYNGYPAPPPGQKKHTPKCGQGFIAWRKCRNGALVADDWILIADAIANRGTEAENALIRRRPLQACDIIVRKKVTLTRADYRGWDDNRTGQSIGKEGRKEYEITCAWISGAPPESLSGTAYAT